MKKLFLSYELSVLAKEKGFNEDCFSYYSYSKKIIVNTNYHQALNYKDIYPAPLYQQIVDWFRNEKGTIIEIQAINYTGTHGEPIEFDYWIWNTKTGQELISDNNQASGGMYNTYYEALDKAIEEAFKLI